MNLVYQTERVTLYHGKSEEVLATFPKESVDLILTDPPYGVSHSSGWKPGQTVIHNDRVEDRDVIREILTHCVRLVGQKRHLYVFGPRDVLSGLKVSEVVELVWDRDVIGQGDLTSTWGPQHEMVSFAISQFRHAGDAGKPTPATRLRKGSVLRFMRPTGRKTKHPNQKPVPLLQELIESSSRQGDLVLDPFAGVSSTGVAAILTGRRSLLIESDERWIDVSVQRLAEAEALMDKVKDL